jgi:carbamoyltransferase
MFMRISGSSPRSLIALDTGGAIGAAFALWHKLNGARSFVMDHAYWGPQFGSDEMQSLMAARQTEIDAAGCSVENIAEEAELCQRTATAIAEGKVVGWSRAAWNGAHGRSATAPLSAIILNAKIKQRESLRPFDLPYSKRRCRSGSRRMMTSLS